MPQIEAVLATVRFRDEALERLRRAFHPAEFIHLKRDNKEAIDAALQRVDVAVVQGDVDFAFLRAPRLRWVHCDHSGLDRSARPELFQRGLLVTSSSGRSAPALAEHVMFFVLALAYNFPALYAAQQSRRWGARSQKQRRALKGQTVGILGLGHIGKEIARRCKAFDMRVLGFRRRASAAPEGVDEIFTLERGDTLRPILEQSDFLILALPLTDATWRIIGASELSQMKPSAFLVNIARGALVDEAALIEALQSGRLAGAGLDVFQQEPLPADSPLWTAPRILITPHATPQLPDRTERSIDIICENIRRYVSGEPLLNLLTEQDVYSHAAAESVPLPPGRGMRLKRWLRRVFRSPPAD